MSQDHIEGPLRVKPFVQRADDGSEDFVVGLISDEDSSAPILALRISSNQLTAAVLLNTSLNIYVDSDGTLRAEPYDVDDEIIEGMISRNRLETTTIDKLVERSLSLDKNEPSVGEHGVLPMFSQLRDTLARALILVDNAIASRKS